MNAQFIKTPNGEDMVLLSRAEFDALVAAAAEAAEDAADVAAYDAAIYALAVGEDEALPAELSEFIHRGDSRLKALRKWRGRGQVEVAQEMGISQSYLSALEAGSRAMTDDLAIKFSHLYDVSTSWLRP